MRILVVGKYPPIEGGVAAHTYWLARGLGELGHTVSVVTNAGRVEEEYRIPLPHMHGHAHRCGPSDYASENVSVHSITEPTPKYIPRSEGFVTRLVNAGLRAIEQHGADIIYSRYLEPYGMASMVLCDITGIPYVVRHAGSDLYRLLKSPDMTFALSRVLTRADAVIAGRPLLPMMRELGVHASRVSTAPRPVFHPLFTPHGEKHVFPKEWDLPSGVPIIVYLGKAQERKGLVETIHALPLVSEDFRFVVVSQGSILGELREQVREHAALRGRVFFSEFVPPWYVPNLLRAASLFIQLESGFDVPIHIPQQAYEAILCGVPVLFSAEMLGKMPRTYQVVHEKFPVVADPRDATGLASMLSAVLADMEQHRAIAKSAQAEASALNDWQAELDWHLDIFNRARSPLARLFRLRR